MGQRILALELSGDRVRGAMADRTFKTLDLLSVREEQRRPEETDLAPAVARVVQATGRPDITVTALPGEFVAKRLLTLPFTDQRRLRQVVPFALEEHLPFAVDDAAVAFARVGQEDSHSLILAAFARKEELNRHLQILADAGLDPKIVTLSSLALAGLLSRARNGAGGSHLVLEIDEASTSMVLIDTGGAPRAMRTVGQGLNLRDDSPRAQAAAKVILSAVRQTLLAHRTDHATPDLVLTSSTNATPNVKQELSAALEVPVHDVTEFDYSSLIRGAGRESSRFSGCLAMLLGEAPSAPLELLNFRQGEFAFRGKTGALGPLRLSAALAIAAAGIAVLHLLLSFSVNLRQLHLLNRQIVEITAPALGPVNGADARTTLDAKIKDMSKRLRLLGGGLGHGSPLDVMLALSRAIPPGVPIQADMLEIDDSGVKLAGSVDTFATVDQIKSSLERSGAFAEIKIEHAGSGNNSSKKEFRLSAKLKNDAGF